MTVAPFEDLGSVVNPHTAVPLLRWGADTASTRLAVLGVHGRGQPTSSIRDQMERIDLPDLAWYVPTAAGSSWYPNRFMEPVESNQPALGQALAAIDAALDEIRADGYDDRSIALFGFSQGACLLAEHVLRHPRRYAALILMTGGFIGPESQRRLDGDLDGLPVVADIAETDPWVPLARARETAAALSSLGASVDFRSHPGTEHMITDQAIDRVRETLARPPGRTSEE